MMQKTATKLIQKTRSSVEKFPKASIVIATLNNEPILKKVIEGLLKLDYPNDFEVIVANDGSTDNTWKMLQGFGNKIKAINFEKRGGVCRTRNAAIKAAKHPILINMDHDCIPDKNWLKDMMKGFENPKVGVVSAYDYFGGTSTGFRKELVERVGGYDEAYFFYREDTDLSFKIMDLGYDFKLVKANYIHDHEMVKPKGLKSMINYVLRSWRIHQNDILLYKKHPTKVCQEFLHIKFGFLIDPFWDFSIATGKWEKGAKLSLSSPRGITVLENKTPLHTLAIVLAGIVFVVGLKLYRLKASIKHGKLLI